MSIALIVVTFLLSYHVSLAAETKSKVLPNCTIRYDKLGLDLDVRRITRNLTQVEVPNIGAPNKKMVLNLCKGLPLSLKCEGKERRSTSACLLETSKTGVKIENTANNSQIVANIMNSTLRISNEKLYLESFTLDRNCTSRGNDSASNVTKHVGFQVEFFCSMQEQDAPTYLHFDDCRYLFKWGSPLMCLNLPKSNVTKESNGTIPAPVINPTSQPPGHATSHDQPDTIKKPVDQHRETLNEATKINQSVAHDQDNSPHQHSSSQSVPQAPSGNSEQPSVKQTVPQPPKMDFSHKLFMISLITMSLVAFLVLILVLDKKTRLRVQLGSIRHHVRQAPPVPYSRVVNDLDL